MRRMWGIVSGQRREVGNLIKFNLLPTRCGAGGFLDRQVESGEVGAKTDGGWDVETERGSGFVRHVISTRVLWFS